jgi:hypothetical protein
LAGRFDDERIISAIRKAEFVSDRRLYIILKGCWCDVIHLKVHASTKDKVDDFEDSFCEELECLCEYISSEHVYNNHWFCWTFFDTECILVLNPENMLNI